ncbi:DUF2637 domain-containing protein [Lentzea tibetensis]|uniref:DUF2637 domain-containing protein n=1 Tax=Lentzea tibetensis TaxID=2591470 RepID=A0A563EF55_9PSEU|nr:DUF2637 domain-containing protein [Lentzea tibetensis]
MAEPQSPAETTASENTGEPVGARPGGHLATTAHPTVHDGTASTDQLEPAANASAAAVTSLADRTSGLAGESPPTHQQHPRHRRPTGGWWPGPGFVFGSVTSIAANVLHTWLPAQHQSPGWTPGLAPQLGAAVWPIGLLLSVEILSRIHWPQGKLWNLARYASTSTVALGSAVISYGHLRDLLLAWHYPPLAAAVGPLVLDGLMTISGFALLAISNQHDRRTGIRRCHGQRRRLEGMTRPIPRHCATACTTGNNENNTCGSTSKGSRDRLWRLLPSHERTGGAYVWPIRGRQPHFGAPLQWSHQQQRKRGTSCSLDAAHGSDKRSAPAVMSRRSPSLGSTTALRGQRKGYR